MGSTIEGSDDPGTIRTRPDNANPSKKQINAAKMIGFSSTAAYAPTNAGGALGYRARHQTILSAILAGAPEGWSAILDPLHDRLVTPPQQLRDRVQHWVHFQGQEQLSCRKARKARIFTRRSTKMGWDSEFGKRLTGDEQALARHPLIAADNCIAQVPLYQFS
jgi:hypothetical protein